jgi:hypothetical protein
VGDKDDLQKELQAQLYGLSKTVEGDTDLRGDMSDYLVTLNSLKKRIEAANKMPDDLRGTQTGRTSASVAGVTPEQMNAAEKALNSRLPITDRRAAIEHTRKLNESRDDS